VTRALIRAPHNSGLRRIGGIFRINADNFIQSKSC